MVAIGHLPPAASVGAECAGFSARCLRLVHGTALPQTLLRSRDVWGARTALESRDLAIGARAGAQWKGAPRRGVGGVRGGVWVGRAPAGSGSGRHVEEGTWCCSNDDACRSAAPPIAPLPSRRVAASRGQYRWCGGGGSLHRPAAGAAITSMKGGCRRLVWLEAYAAPPKPYCRSSAWRLGRAAVVVADGIWRRRRRLALPSGRNSDPAALAGGGAPTAARPWLRAHTPYPFSSTAIRACCAPAWCVSSSYNPR